MGRSRGGGGGGGGAARAPDGARFFSFHQVNAVIVAGMDVTIVQQEVIGNAVKSAQGLVVILADRLLAQVATGHDQRSCRMVEEDMVQGRIG
jgi:hypothetical protein